MPKQNTKSSTSQSESFKKTARELGCDEDEAAFEDQLRRIAQAPPQPKSEKKKPRLKSRGKEV